MEKSNASKFFQEKLAFYLIDLLNEKEWNEISTKIILEKFNEDSNNKFDWIANDKVSLIDIFYNAVNVELLAEAKNDFVQDPDASIREKLTDIILRKCEKHEKHKFALRKLRKLSFYDPTISLSFLMNINFLTRHSLLISGDKMEGYVGEMRLFGVAVTFTSIFEQWITNDNSNDAFLMKKADKFLKRAEEIGRGINII